MLAGGGIRTLSNKEVRFKPGAYHNGSVWLFDNFQIRKGLIRHGYTKEAAEIEKRLKKVYKKLKVFPEFVRGDEEIDINRRTIDIWDKKDGRKNRIEQPPQLIQAWSVSAFCVLLGFHN
jgi:glycogen debranching enzyme